MRAMRSRDVLGFAGAPPLRACVCVTLFQIMLTPRCLSCARHMLRFQLRDACTCLAATMHHAATQEALGAPFVFSAARHPLLPTPRPQPQSIPQVVTTLLGRSRVLTPRPGALGVLRPRPQQRPLTGEVMQVDGGMTPVGGEEKSARSLQQMLQEPPRITMIRECRPQRGPVLATVHLAMCLLPRIPSRCPPSRLSASMLKMNQRKSRDTMLLTKWSCWRSECGLLVCCARS